MTTLTSLAMLRFGFHGHGGSSFLFLLIIALGAAVCVWALTRSGRNSA